MPAAALAPLLADFAGILEAALGSASALMSPRSAVRSAVRAQVSVAATSDEIDRLQPVWMDLERRCPSPAPFQTFAWSRRTAAAAEAAGYGRARIVTLRRGGEPVLLAPLMLRRVKGVGVVQWLGEPLAEFGDLLVTEQATAADAELLLRTVRNWTDADLLWLRNVRADGVIERLLPSCRRERLADDAAPFAGPEEPRRESRGRKRLRTKQAKLEALGPVRLEHANGPEAAAVAAAAVELKCRWLRERGVFASPLLKPEWRQCLIELAGSEGGHVGRLMVGDRIAAYEIGFRHRDHYASWMGAFEPEFSACSPGRLLTEAMIDWCRGEGLVYDLLPPDDPYKREHAGGSVPVAHRLVPLSLRGQLAGAVLRSRPAIKALYARAPLRVRQSVGRVLSAGR
jgi:CelD/BcsL family acetyltransferase involved in cellulose biosynthesis